MNSTGNPTDDPTLRCDVVMKGGVTSGVVYPGAIAKLAETFRFVNIGGTSAGAIAAAITAAAEYNRQTGNGYAGFKKVDAIPTELAKNHTLFRLFKPNDRTRSYFNILMTFFAKRATVMKVFGIIRIAINGFPISTIVPGALAYFLCLHLHHAGEWSAEHILLSALFVVLSSCTGLAVGIVIGGYRAFVKNEYGLCSGMSDKNRNDQSVLSSWLSEKIDNIAGMPPNRPLTLGDLWCGRLCSAQDDEVRPTDPMINLEMVTTCVSHGRPYTFPVDQHLLLFKPADLLPFVPRYVIEHMKRCSVDAPASGSSSVSSDYAIMKLPPMRDLPVVLVARMSLSFPVLLRPVPLYAIDYGSLSRQFASAEAYPEKCWFSDGGLSSNFPIHSFDSPLPNWPTFGLNLGSFRSKADYDPKNQAANVWMPANNQQGLQDTWQRFSNPKGFFECMLSAIREWQDKMMMRMPGYRDRVVTVLLDDDEGGLNLDMESAKIIELADRGRAAGAELVRRFAVRSTGAFTGKMDWENHRIIRYRATMDRVQRYFDSFEQVFRAASQPGDCSYDALIGMSSGSGVTMRPYPWPKSKPVGAAAQSETRKIVALSNAWRSSMVDFSDGSPRPRGKLAVRSIF